MVVVVSWVQRIGMPGMGTVDVREEVEDMTLVVEVGRTRLAETGTGTDMVVIVELVVDEEELMVKKQWKISKVQGL